MSNIKRREVSNSSMVAGNEIKYRNVILDGSLKEWIGFGWITLREATDEDKEMYPTVEED